MKVDKMSVSMDPNLGDEVRAAAQHSGKNLSSWMAEAASAKLRSEALSKFLDDWEDQHGPLTSEELCKAEAELGLRAREAR
jgi:hypothetical protein